MSRVNSAAAAVAWTMTIYDKSAAATRRKATRRPKRRLRCQRLTRCQLLPMARVWLKVLCRRPPSLTLTGFVVAVFFFFNSSCALSVGFILFSFLSTFHFIHYAGYYILIVKCAGHKKLTYPNSFSILYHSLSRRAHLIVALESSHTILCRLVFLCSKFVSGHVYLSIVNHSLMKF